VIVVYPLSVWFSMGILFSCCRAKEPTTKAAEPAESYNSFLFWSSHRGPSVVVGADLKVSGSGSISANSQLLQNKSYWEIRILSISQTGSWCIGVTRDVISALDRSLYDRPDSWCCSSLSAGISSKPDDVIGIFYDLSGVRTVISFSLNGVPQPNLTITNIKGDVYPAVSVAGDCCLQANFGQQPFRYQQQMKELGFEAPIMVRSVM